MWVQRIRLKNIKSYGEGANGEGITIQLEPGINQIAGKNGTGKSTLIEAIGYALFDAEPVRGNARMAKNTYLLRNGSKAGEVDVWVWHEDCLYRVERDVGNGGRRWKVVRQDDDFIEAEGEKEVKDFIANLAGVENSERLAEVYHSLLGVKQGRFTIPFDLKPSEAKNHFDPLLDVDIFRQCFEYLKGPCDEVRQEIANQRAVISGLEGQISQLQDAPEKYEEAVKQRVTLEALVEKSQQQQHHAAGQLAQYEILMNNYQAARLKVSEAKNLVAQANNDAATCSTRVEEAKQANRMLQQNQAAYQAYLELEQQISVLEKERLTRDQIQKTLANGQREEMGLARDLLAKGQEGQRDRENAAQKQQDYQTRWQQLSLRLEQFQAGESDCQLAYKQAEELRKHLASIVEWLRGMSAVNKPAIEQLADLEQILQQLNGKIAGQLAQAKEELTRLEEQEQQCRLELERTRQAKAVLEQQLARLSGGQCPLLGTACNQFNPAKSKADLDSLTQKFQQTAIAQKEALKLVAEARKRVEYLLAEEKSQLEKQARASQLAKGIVGLYGQLVDVRGRAAAEVLAKVLQSGGELPKLSGGVAVTSKMKVAGYRAAVEEMKALQMALYERYQGWQPSVEKRYKAAQDTLAQRVGQKKELAAEETALKNLTEEIKKLNQRAAESEQRAERIEAQLNKIRREIKNLQQQLAPFQELDNKLALATANKANHLPGYTLYLQNQPVAAKQQAYLTMLQESQDKLKGLQAELIEWEQRFQQAEAAYNPARHKELKDTYAKANLALGEATSKLAEAVRLVKEQQQRVKVMQGLLQQREEQYRELLRLQAQESILERARYILKNAQEPVARSLTARVAAQAQVIYNTMSNEAAQFHWRSGDYSLTVTTVSGEKRFTSLSGGQQMKAAMAMQLAMVKEFSQAGFCAFDEPTYGLDAESRNMLAEAIGKAQEECKFEQLLLVSHDQAFDDKVEHALKLEYSPMEGTKL
ncbi:SMC family ATPase [Desulfotomaculum sp. 1211_IL3151]|uniref:SMC family ATPase n=1 Tax=Desulfotomaculum sp. 1211_IL3151 TaxID=3084055 RepID=UPI002FD8BB0D